MQHHTETLKWSFPWFIKKNADRFLIVVRRRLIQTCSVLCEASGGWVWDLSVWAVSCVQIQTDRLTRTLDVCYCKCQHCQQGSTGHFLAKTLAVKRIQDEETSVHAPAPLHFILFPTVSRRDDDHCRGWWVSGHWTPFNSAPLVKQANHDLSVFFFGFF